eukprot:TRINITY_DN8650_c0_g1_i1.p1 TRINITY_DN8650_c0_g1~~TRINITY_DN8650_c0_g1_i1.p1  ORF type:complete len:242 (+),score=54.38 TRINITY_DN8650_c0_g1_i1:59-727(+)
MDEAELQALYLWVDEVPLSRPKRNIARDFSDGVLMAELIKHFFPKLIDLHNYSATQSVVQKRYNWATLDTKVFKKLHFEVSKDDINEVTACVPGAVERVLSNFKTKVLQLQQKRLHEQHMKNNAANGPSKSSAPTAPFVRPAAGSVEQAVRSAAAGPSSPWPTHTKSQRDYTSEIIAEKDETINEMKETIEILEVKIRKLEQLVKIKDHKIQALQTKLQQPG